ncbi:MAG TPA: hypothetical protein VFV19_14090 [Candidatus Polarisedimenticolaceae bacterium]|nr:hypothetical protein [Candidatus Polarisedimenticolaceae bacterium]
MICCLHSGYAVRVEGRFLDRSRYAIHAVVTYPHSTSTEERARLAQEAQVDLLVAIAEQSHLGRKRGARFVYVAVEGDRELDDFFRMRAEGVPPELVA